MANETSNLNKALKGGRMRIAAAMAVVALVGGGLSMIMLQGGEGGKALLYSGLDLTESAEIAGKLDQANIPYEMRGDGASIFVDRARVLDARMMLSEDGLPTRGSVGYEIFDKTETLGTTTFVQNVNRIRALEGELARTIASLDIVRAARVHLVLPERRLFERDAQRPSGSIVLSVAGRGMSQGQVRAIRNLVASAVPGLEIDRLSVLDDEGRLLAAGAESSENGFGGASADEREFAIEERIRSTVLEIVESVTGPGAARVQVSADIDFNRITQSSETYDPESRVIRSTQTVEESASEASNEPLEGVSAAANVPDGADAPDTSATSEMASNRTEETVNYEISKTTRTEIVEGGRIQRVSVAVAVDDARQINEDGGFDYSPRAEEELQRIATLVRSAIGFDEARGDVVDVVNVSFVRPNASMEGAEAPGAFDFDKHDIMRGAEIFGLLATALALIFLVLRPLVKGLMTTPDPDETTVAPAISGLGVTAAVPNPNAQIALPDVPLGAETAGASAIGAAGADGQISVPDDLSVDVARIAGRVRASSVKKISEVVETHPDESLQIIRGWLNEDHPDSETEPA
ncbi:MAG: flagellar basal-body MS-ring/collar protein FliF [Pseudomonadota bacterium]